MFLHQTFVSGVFLGTLLFHLSFYFFVLPTYNFIKMGKKCKPSTNMNLSFKVFAAVVDRVALCVFHTPCSTEFAKNSENVLPPSSGWILVHFFHHNYFSIYSNQSHPEDCGSALLGNAPMRIWYMVLKPKISHGY